MTMLIGGLIAFVAGYYLCAVATWIRVHHQESEIRALSVAIGVMMDMDDEVPPAWVQAQLDSIVAKEYSR